MVTGPLMVMQLQVASCVRIGLFPNVFAVFHCQAQYKMPYVLRRKTTAHLSCAITALFQRFVPGFHSDAFFLDFYMALLVGAHSLNILSRLESLSGGPSGGGCNWWQLRPHGNMGMAVPSHHPGHLTWDQGCVWYFGRWEVHRSSPNHSQTRSFNRKSQNTPLLVIDPEYRTGSR